MKIPKLVSSALRHIRTKEFCLVFLFFFIATCFLTNWVILQVNTMLFTGGVGDGTSGFLWLVHADKGWGYMDDHTSLVNFPFGESLWSPVYITWTLVLGPLWFLSRFLSPIAAMNIMMFIGFISAGIAAYYLIKRLTNSWAIALFGGYSITFVPYHIMKGVDHFTNIFSWVFVFIIATFMMFWRRPSVKHGLLLAFSIAAACYTDGYYIFVAGVLMLALLIAAVATDALTKTTPREILHKISMLLLVGVGSIIIMLPILYIQIQANDQIKSDLSNARENVKAEIGYYSSKPIDFLLPVNGNITASTLPIYEELNQKKNSRSNSGENATYIGYVILALYAVGAMYALKALRESWLSRSKLSTIDYILVTSVIAPPFALAWMIAPEVNMLGLRLYMPTALLAEYVPYWRVPARVFLAMHPLMIIAACIALYKISIRVSKRSAYVLVGVVFILTAVEYYTNIKRPSFGVDSMPKTYQWLKDQEDIRSVAEIPLLDRPIEIGGYAVFAQIIHGKSLVNSALAKTDTGLFNPLANQDNPETINFLRSRNVDAVVIHSRACVEYPWGQLLHSEENVYSPEFIDKEARSLCVYRLVDQEVADDLYISAAEGFMKTNYLNDEGNYWAAIKGGEAVMKAVSHSGESTKESGYALIVADMNTVGGYDKASYRWGVYQEGDLIVAGDTSMMSKIEASIDVTKSITIKVEKMDGSPVGPAEVGLRNIQIKRE